MRENSAYFCRCLRFILFFLLPLTSYYLSAQPLKNPLPVEKLGVAQGLSHRQPSVLLQDRYGFMWIGTVDGLNRYNGYDFTVYKHQLNDTTSLSDNFVGFLYEDKKGTLWIATENGLNRYNRAQNNFTVYKPQPKAIENPANVIFNILEDKKGEQFWVVTAAAVYLFDRQQEKFTLIKGLDCGCIHSLYEGPAGTIWGATGGANKGGLYQVDAATLQVTHFTHDPQQPTGLTNPTVMKVQADAVGDLWVIYHIGGVSRLVDARKGVFEHYPLTLPTSQGAKSDTLLQAIQDRRGTLWLGANGGRFYQFNKQQRKFIAYIHDTPAEVSRFHNYFVSYLFEDQSGKIWMGTWSNGVKVFDPQTKQFAHYVNDSDNPKSFFSHSGDFIYQDRAGSVWIIGQNSLNRIDPWAKPFRHYEHHPNNNRSLSNNAVFGFSEDPNGTVWIATANGLNAFNPEQNQFSQYLPDTANPNSLSHNLVRAVHADSKGLVWAGVLLGLDRLDPQRGVFTHYKLNPKEPKSMDNHTLALYEDRQGKLWVRNGVQSIFSHFDRVKGTYIPFTYSPQDSNSIANQDVRCIYEDKQGFVWFASQGSGVHRYDRRSGRFTRYYHHPQNPQSICSNQVFFIYEDRNENLWFGTPDGLSQWDRRRNVFVNYHQRHGLPSEQIAGILEDAAGQLWISTQTAIVRFNPRTKVFRTYTQDDGVMSTDFREGAFYRARSGDMYFGSMVNGFEVFHPDLIKDNPNAPPVIITQFKKDNQPFNFATYLPDLKQIMLNPADKVISFEYVALNFSHAAKNQYAYQLVGLEKDWVYCGSRREAIYTNLVPGEYTFRVKAANNDGIWNDQGASLRVIIPPPYYQTWWFRALILLTLMGLGYSFYRYRIRQVRHEEQLKAAFDKQLAEVSMMALRAQMNPHFLFNSLNSINHFILKNNAEEASVYLTKFSRLIRLILSNAQTETVLLSNELEALKLYIQLEQLRFNNGFMYTIEVAEDVETDYIEVPPLLIQPYVENAIWHGLLPKAEPGHLWLRLYRQEAFLYIIIQDDGIGRKKALELKSKSATKNKSLGMQITADRVDLLNKLKTQYATVEIIDLEDLAGTASGTKVILRLPVS